MEGEMKGKGIGISKVVHIGVVVKDLERSMEQYFRTMGIGPWHVYTLRPPFLQEIFFGKEKIYLAMKLAMAQLGNVAMELIQPISEGNPYTEFLERCGEGVHHLGVEVEDYEQALSFFKERGIPLLMEGTTQVDAFAYVDTQLLLGTVIELNKRPKDFKMPPPEAIYPP
jgi:catechol 2,3-dioxygenase-like lactoylglutathione lyase family enzyme